MSEIVIQVENLAKKYIIGHQPHVRYTTLREELVTRVRSLGRRFLTRGQCNDKVSSRTREEFWALRDISFEIQAGEVVGIIGRNGAGKSTLLKLLSRITAPSKGRIRMRGIVSSLLEVGTGFHQELTGRENIFLNGAILGMSRKETSRKFDDIVAFAEMEQFLDTPVKHYSSGMYMRLAFSVAAHLEPEILIVDEVLAVGDLAFQAKCLGKMEGVAQGGRTVLLVSHNMSAVQRLCKTALLLEGGLLRTYGSSGEVIQEYLSSVAEYEGAKVWNAGEGRPLNSVFRPIALRLRDCRGRVAGQVLSREPFTAELEYELTTACQGLQVALCVSSGQGDLLFVSGDLDDPAKYEVYWNRQPGCYRVQCHFPSNLFNAGRFFLGLQAQGPNSNCFFQDEHALSFCVDGTGGIGSHWAPPVPTGFFRPLLNWDIECHSQSNSNAGHSAS